MTIKNLPFVKYLLEGKGLAESVDALSTRIHEKALSAYEELKESIFVEGDIEINPDMREEDDSCEDCGEKYDEGFETGYESAMKDSGATEVKKESTVDELDEKDLMKINRVRVGKVQRNKLISNRIGFKLASGKLVKMTSQEMRTRSIASRKGAIKARSKQNAALKKRNFSVKVGKRAGIYDLNKQMKASGENLVKLDQ